jgi:ABC-2 type transport system permease protein
MKISRILAIAGAQILRLSRDTATLAMLVAVPIVGALVFGLADQRANDSLIVGIVKVDSARALTSDLVAQLKREPELRVNEYANLSSLKRAVRRGDVQAGVLLPAAYEHIVGGPKAVNVSLLGDGAQSAFVGARASVLLVVDRESLVVAQARRLARTGHESIASALPAARAALDATSVSTDKLTAHGLTKVSGLGRSVAGMLVFFTFAVAMSYAVNLSNDRRTGMLARVATTRASDSEIILGEIGSRFAISAGQGFAIVVVSSLLLGVRWGNLFGVALIILVFALVSACLGVLIGYHLSGSHEQTVFASDGVMALLGVVGGCFFALALLPDWAREAGHLAPHAWAVDAFDRLRATNGGVGAIGTALLVLAGMACVTFIASVRSLRHALHA